MELDPTHTQAAQNLAMLYFQMKQKDKALRIIEKMKANGLEINQDFVDRAKQ